LEAALVALREKCAERYSGQLYNESAGSALTVASVQPQYDSQPEMVDGRVIIRDNWDWVLSNIPGSIIFGEDVGKIGGVNQTAEGLQEKYGDLRVSDTGIREATIIGQGIGMAMRGLRPIAEIQYLDYLYYALQIMRDDLATVHWRTRGGQRAPLIISTRGHRLEGVWHAGSPMAAIISSVRGMHVCVPRNMTQAAGMYNTLLAAQEPEARKEWRKVSFDAEDISKSIKGDPKQLLFTIDDVVFKPFYETYGRHSVYLDVKLK
jgi:hypothetical protein